MTTQATPPPAAPPAGAPPPQTPPAGPPPTVMTAPPPAAPPAGAPPTDWKTVLPEEFRAHTALQDYKDLGGFVKSHINLQSMIGQDKVALINDKSTPEQVAEFYNKLGRPEKAEEYKLPPVKFSNGATIPEDTTKHFMGVFHKHGLSQKQAEGLMKDFADYEGQKLDSRLAAVEKGNGDALKALQDKWGAAFPERVAAAQALVKTCGSPELVAWLNETRLGDNPNFIEFFANMGMMVIDDKAVGGGGINFTRTPDQAATEIASLKKDKSFIDKLTNKMDPAHKDAKEKWDQLHAQLAKSNEQKYVAVQ